MNFRSDAGGHRLQSYRMAPENVPLPAEPASQLRRLAQTAIGASLPGKCREQGRPGTLTWWLAGNRMEIGY